MSDWPDQVVANSLGAMITNDEVRVWRDYDEGAVGIEAGEHRALLTASQAKTLAEGYEDSLKKRDLYGRMQTAEVTDMLRRYANEIEPYSESESE